MQADVDAQSTSVPIRIFGVNQAGQESGNDLASDGNDIGLLQDTVAEDAWGDWGVTWRDVVVLDTHNVPIATVNLTTHNLSDPTEYEALRQILLTAAQ